MAKVSVLMSSYNHQSFISEAIHSVLKQSFQDWEFLIIDDCSTDESFLIAKKFENQDSRIKVFKSPYNRGMVQNTNELILASKGEYIAIINSDDYWEEKKLEKQVDFLDNNREYGACFTSVNMINEGGKIILNKKKPQESFIIIQKYGLNVIGLKKLKKIKILMSSNLTCCILLGLYICNMLYLTNR